MTREQLNAILAKPGVAARNSHLAGLRAGERKRDPGAALVSDSQAKQEVPGRVGICVTIIAVRKRSLDSDNLQGAYKKLRDCIARTIGIDDGDPRLVFEYGQIIGSKRGTLVKLHQIQLP